MPKKLTCFLLSLSAFVVVGCGSEPQSFSPPKQPDSRVSPTSADEDELTPLGQRVAEQEDDKRAAEAVIPAPIALDALGRQLLSWAPQAVEPASVGSGLPLAAAAWRSPSGTTITLFVTSVDATSAAQVLASYGLTSQQHANALVVGELPLAQTRILDALATGAPLPESKKAQRTKPATKKKTPSQSPE